MFVYLFCISFSNYRKFDLVILIFIVILIFLVIVIFIVILIKEIFMSMMMYLHVLDLYGILMKMYSKIILFVNSYICVN